MIIKIRNLEASTIVGVYGWEQKTPRPVVLNIEMHMADAKAAGSDRLADTVDYAMVEEKVAARLKGTSYQLIERLAADIGQFILSLDPRIEKVTVEADKPGALKQSASVAVQMTVRKG